MSDTPKGQMMSQIENWPGECLHGLGARARTSLRCLLTAMPLGYLMAANLMELEYGAFKC